LSDPIADTPMVVTLDQLRPYDHDPRRSAIPYEEISIHSRTGPGCSAGHHRRPGEISSSATAATRAWRSCVNSGRKRGTALLPHIVPVSALAARAKSSLTGHLAENGSRGLVHRRALGVESSRVL
jgi:hypothetical protein